MHSKKSTSAADAVHQAALNVHNTNNLASDLRNAHVEPAAHSELRQGMVGQNQDRNHDGIPDNQQHMSMGDKLKNMLPGANKDKNHDGIPDSQQRGATQAPVFHADNQQPMHGQNISAPMNVQGHHSHQQQQSYNTSTVSAAPLNQGMSQTRTTNTVQSVTRDAQAQIDAQVAEALAKSRALNAQDHARLQSSIGSATASLEQQAAQLKQQIDEEKRRAEAEVMRTQQEKLQSTAARQSMEEKAILEAAAARKLELEQKSMKLQREIEEITRLKTAEMMAEKPGNLQFTHEHQDATVSARLAGDIGHVLDITKGGHVTNTTTGGEVQYHPVQVQETAVTGRQQAMAQEQSIATAHTHQQHGAMHAMKTMLNPTSNTYNTQQSASVPLQQSTTTTTTQGLKQQQTPVYDQHSQWSNTADKLAQK